MGTSSRSSSTLKNPFQTFKSFYTIQPTTRTARMTYLLPVLILSFAVLMDCGPAGSAGAAGAAGSAPPNRAAAATVGGARTQLARRPASRSSSPVRARSPVRFSPDGVDVLVAKGKKIREEMIVPAMDQLQQRLDALEAKILSVPMSVPTMESTAERVEAMRKNLWEFHYYLSGMQPHQEQDPENFSDELLDKWDDIKEDAEEEEDSDEDDSDEDEEAPAARGVDPKFLRNRRRSLKMMLAKKAGKA